MPRNYKMTRIADNTQSQTLLVSTKQHLQADCKQLPHIFVHPHHAPNS